MYYIDDCKLLKNAKHDSFILVHAETPNSVASMIIWAGQPGMTPWNLMIVDRYKQRYIIRWRMDMKKETWCRLPHKET